MGFAKTICNKTQGLKIAADNLRGRVYEVNHADLTKDAPTKDQAFRNVKFEVLEVNGRNLLTQFHSLSLTTDKIRSLLRKWCTLIEAPLEVTTADGYRLRLFAMCFTKKQRGQLSKNCYSKTRLEKWVRLRMQKIATARLSKLNINDAVTMLMNDVLVDEMSKRCNAIVPLRDVKFSKVKVIRTPKFEMAKLTTRTARSRRRRRARLARSRRPRSRRRRRRRTSKPDFSGCQCRIATQLMRLRVIRFNRDLPLSFHSK